MEQAQENLLYFCSTRSLYNNLPSFIHTADNNVKYYLLWDSHRWVISKSLDFTKSNMLVARSAEQHRDSIQLLEWYVKDINKTFHKALGMKCNLPLSVKEYTTLDTEGFGLPRRLVPYFIGFLLDSMATGLILPILPFYVMQLGANALQLSLVISVNYIAQMFGCITMGKISDLYGRRTAFLLCLTASALSYFSVSYASNILLVVLARLITGICGGLVPIMQSTVADTANAEDRPKYLGRITATFGLGFVLGPVLSTALPTNMTPKGKMQVAACLSLLGLVIAALSAKETKAVVRPLLALSHSTARKGLVTPDNSTETVEDSTISTTSTTNSTYATLPQSTVPLNSEVIFLVLNAFLIMYAFGTETIYAVFIKDTFGYSEAALSGIFAVNGLLTGIFQIFCIKPLIGILGMHFTLALGNILLGLGMLGLGFVREKIPHFLLFACHILGFTIADTALVSLISRYSAPVSQGRDLALCQAANSCARIFSPLIAGLLYERSRELVRTGTAVLPFGALPFLVGGLCPLLGLVIPALLHARHGHDRLSGPSKEHDTAVVGAAN